ncbi:MAG: 30S ribosomal protein S4e [Candidatus Methanofastidiosum methylothiophilum]|uniref:Small ribosomal subunit protein eS4 n=1 Tax=Candidatus Methanofastidiosum methylothiophilum TaxID=1705564 RepID=A0A150IWY7_9EURY|nr:MAG: 30S ribosomal protein S4e [Candidatus Methanofastidiosum methylthiophilus]KYC47083.1 MAG: 30S ribosomal protein S4e [Candidatus Methanofastidiosum methylthiophilus]KYC49519.1 MAG: 30S ribosomal protein S4e [Candidatus Methanofastidiosum methylthiophilus]
MGRKGQRRSLKRLFAPKNWRIERKVKEWTVRPIPGPHSKEVSIPITILLRDYLGHATNRKEVNFILNNGDVLVNGRAIKNSSFPVGIMDVIEIPKTKEYFRVLFDKKGSVTLVKIDESEKNTKLFKLINKTMITGNKLQLNLHDGTNVLSNEGYPTSSTLVMKVPEMKVVDSLEFKEGYMGLVIKGKNVSKIGKISKITEFGIYKDTVLLESGNDKFQTLKDYVLIVGKESPIIKVE